MEKAESQIPDLQKAPAALPSSSDQHLALGLSIPGVALGAVEYATGLNHLSAEAARLFGLGDAAVAVPRELVHGTFHPDDIGELMKRMAASLDPVGEGWFAMEHRVVWPNGEVHWLTARKQVYFEGPPGALRPARAGFAVRDITAEKIAAASVQASEFRMNLALEASKLGIWEWNVLTKVIHWDPHMFQLYGVPPTADGLVPYHTWSDRVLPEDLAGQEARLRQAILSSLQSQSLPLPGAFGQKILAAQASIEQAVDTVHRFARDLRPSMLDDLGLRPALEAHLKDFQQLAQLQVDLIADPGIEALDSAARTVLYRTAQEALTNVARHAAATHVTVTIQQQPDGVRMDIMDNGKGFAPVLPGTLDPKSNRLGLLGMRERVEMAGGTFSIDSAPGGPTTLRVELLPSPRNSLL